MPLRGPVPVKLYNKESAEVIHLGPLVLYLFEDGSNTDNRVGCAVIEVPKGKAGPPMHWHRFHDECFYVTKGTVRFSTPDGHIDTEKGGLMVVPPRAVHTFSNPCDEEDAEMFFTSTPGYYIDYFRMLGKATEDGKTPTSAEVQQMMALFGTFPPNVDSEP